MKYVLAFFEILFSPITFLFRTNLGNPNNNKTLNPIIIFVIGLVATALIILMFYWVPLFNVSL